MKVEELAQKFIDEFQKFRMKRITDDVHRSSRGIYLVLRYLSLQEKEISSKDISDNLHVSSARMAIALHTLEEKHLITKQTCESDGRKMLITITDEGRNVLENRNANIIELLEGLFTKLGKGDAEDLVRIFTKLNIVLDENGGDTIC